MSHPTASCVNWLLNILLLLSLVGCGSVRPSAPRLVNQIQMSNGLLTSGQPATSQLAQLEQRAFRLIVDLAPGEGAAPSRDEASLLADKGIAYVAIPVDPEQPTYADFALFASTLRGLGQEPVWVYCLINRRASIFAFLYQVIHEGADPEVAFDRVLTLGVPNRKWVEFTRDTLARHGIVFEF